MSINEKIKKLRNDLGIKQIDLANYLDIDQSYISKIESGERIINVDLLEKLADLFSCSIFDIIDDKKNIELLCFSHRNKTLSDLDSFSKANKIIKNYREMIDLGK